MKRETLDKAIPFHGYIALGFGIIVGIGWVVYSGAWLKAGGPMGAMLAFLIGGLFLLPVGRVYAELTSSLPVAGGEVAFTYKAFGPLLSFFTAWGLAYAYVSISPYESIALGALTESLFPLLKTAPLYMIGDDPVSWSNLIPGVVGTALLIWVNIRGMKNSAKLQTWVVYTLIASSLIFVSVALVKGDLTNLIPLFADQSSSWTAIPASIVGVLVVVPFFMTGFDAIPQAAEEAGTKMEPRYLGIAILASIIAGAFFYVVIILCVSMVMPWQESANLSMTSAAVFREAFGFEWAAKVVLFTALLGIITTFNGMIIAASRLLFSLGRGGLLPHWFAEVHPKHHTPYKALLFVGAAAMIGPFVGMAGLSPIVSSSSFVFSSALLLSCISALKLRKSAPDIKRPFRATKADMIAGMIVSSVLLLLMVAPWSPGKLGSTEWAIIAGWVFIGLVFYLVRQRQNPLSMEAQSHLILGEFK